MARIGRLGAFVGLLTLGAALASACSATKQPTDFAEGGGGVASSTTGGGASDQGGAGGSILPGTGGGGGDSTTATGCAQDTTEAQQVPLDMYIMLDQSGSMDGSSWTAVTNALGTFVQQPGTEGMSVGIQYFPLGPGGTPVCPDMCNSDADCGACGPCQPLMPGFPGPKVCAGSMKGDSCVAADYANPEVEIEPLPGVAPKIIDSMAKHKPSGGTPTSAALQGAIDHAKAWAAAHPNHSVIVVFASDGEPMGCDEDLNNINAIAASAFNSTPSIATFVIGVGSKISALNGIAAAGGTGTAVFAEGAQAQQQFLDAMNKIRGTALACNYFIPMPEKGTPDYGKVNVQYTPGGGQGDFIKKVIDQAACANGDGWYYDNNEDPKTIVMCPATCDMFKQDDKGKVDIVTGCKSVVQ